MGVFEDVTVVPDDCAQSAESLEIARLSEKQEDEVSSSESLHLQDSQKGSPCPRKISLSSSINGGFHYEKKEQPDLSSLSSQTHGCPSPISCTKFISRPRSPPPPPSETPSPSSPSRTPQPSPLLSIRSSRSYSLPLTPTESPRIPDTHLSPSHVRRKPPRTAAAQAASCEDLSSQTSPRTLIVRPNTPMGRVDIAPSEAPPSNPYAILSPAIRGRSLTPADRYDVYPSSEDPYGRRYTRSPHPSRARPISPHSASSSYLHLPPLPPMPNRPTPGKRTSLGTMSRTPMRERNVHPGGGQRFESDTDALLTKLCGQDKLLRGLEDEIGQLRAEKERLEKALEVTRLRLEECKGQDATMEKIGYQQRQLQDELVQIRARLCDLALDQAAAQQDLWRIHDILAGLRSSQANYHILESRRSGASLAITPSLDSHLGANNTPLMPSTGAEQSPPASKREQPGSVLCHSEGNRWSPNTTSGNPPEFDKGNAMRGTDAACLNHGSHTNILSKDAEPSIAKPLPNTPPESSPKEGEQTGGLKPPRCPPTPEWERQRVIQLSYALAAEASQQQGKRFAGRTSSRSSLDDICAPHDSLNHQHLSRDATSKDSESSSKISEHDQRVPQNLSCSGCSSTANQAPSSSQTVNRALCASEASVWPLPHPEEDNQLSSKPKTPQLTPHLLESNNEKPPLSHIPHQVAPLPQFVNGNLSLSRTADWVSPLLWDYEVWASEQSLVGSSQANGRYLRWRGENESHHVVTYRGEAAQPVKVTLVKSSF
ncbi:hypothetical protein JD844_001552 [Phrynosoma platyrhinos]|uniref:Pleckstrin homology domain-containing protein n=1 Tax=Phrynosoma platyrhinos TaxID=52577 RepID=A0ABQ7TAN5_PHRPL|nr:hypothetical protein JD844_001552 [Phrynosoma platyrhinos]